MPQDPCNWTVSGYTDCETPIWLYGCTGGYYPGQAPGVCPNCGRDVDTKAPPVVEIASLRGAS